LERARTCGKYYRERSFKDDLRSNIANISMFRSEIFKAPMASQELTLYLYSGTSLLASLEDKVMLKVKHTVNSDL
jgi:hypothetical protein